MFILFLFAGFLLMIAAAAVLFTASEEMYPFAFLLGVGGAISFVLFLGGMANSIGEFERAFKESCVAIGGQTFEGEWNAATKVAETECVRFVDGKPVNISGEAKNALDTN